MVHMQCILADVRRIRLGVWNIRSSSFTYELIYGAGRGIHSYPHKGENGDKIKAMGTSHYFIICQVVLLGVSDSCVKKNQTYALYL